MRGSSPRVRGKLHLLRCRRVGEGLIPACAGKTRCPATGCRSRRAHPRVCGENRRAPCLTGRGVGSSPRVRGKPRGSGAWRPPGGLIPACAGKTGGDLPHPVKRGAHPRVCGENRFDTDPLLHDDGSSPRVRGKLPRRLHRRHPFGLIPACAGKTGRSRCGWTCAGAHPRVCGENSIDGVSGVAAAGSSARVRGKHRSGHQRHLGGGLIPACAGKTASHRASPGRRPAHPRVCGENESIGKLLFQGDGSSPRVRGKRDHGLLRRGPPGLIPACAGKTLRRRASAS